MRVKIIYIFPLYGCKRALETANDGNTVDGKYFERLSTVVVIETSKEITYSVRVFTSRSCFGSFPFPFYSM